MPSTLTQRRVFVDFVLISNHYSILGLPYLTDTASATKEQCSLNDHLSNMHCASHREELMDSLLSTEPITMHDIAANLESKESQRREDRQSEHSDDDEKSIEIVLSSHCKIYATSPTKQYGKLLMKSLSSSNAPLFVRDHGDAVDGDDGPRIYGAEQIESALARISTVQLNERRGLLPGGELDVICISSGLSIGSSNWIISGPAVTMAIVMGSCGATNRHPKSISLSPHFDVPGNVDVMLLDDLQSVELDDESPNDALQAIERKIVETVSNKGTLSHCFSLRAVTPR